MILKMVCQKNFPRYLTFLQSQQYFVKAGLCNESEDYLFRSFSFLLSHNCYILNNHPVSYTTAREAVVKLLGEIRLNPNNSDYIVCVPEAL